MSDDERNFVPFGDWRLHIEIPEPRYWPDMPERGQDRSTPARVINIAPDISDERRAEIEAAVRNGLGISPNDGLGITG